MKVSKCLIVVLVILLTAVSALAVLGLTRDSEKFDPLIQASEEITACDRLAADPRDDNRVAPGVWLDDIDIAAAGAACSIIDASSPQRQMLQLARVYMASRRYEEAIPLLEGSFDGGYYHAARVLGALYEVHGALDRSLVWAERGAKKGDRSSKLYALELCIGLCRDLAEREEARAELELLASDGDSEAEYLLANNILAYLSDPEEMNDVRDLLRLSAEDGWRPAMPVLSVLLYWEAEGGLNEEATHWAEAGARLGDDASAKIASFYRCEHLKPYEAYSDPDFSDQAIENLDLPINQMGDLMLMFFELAYEAVPDFCSAVEQG